MKIYCRGYPVGLSDDELIAIFARFGTVVSVYRPERTGGRIAFVDMANDVEALHAISGLHRRWFRQARLFVQPARPTTRTPASVDDEAGVPDWRDIPDVEMHDPVLWQP